MSVVSMDRWMDKSLASSTGNLTLSAASSPSPTSLSRASRMTEVELPNELLRHIFLYCDPATLCTAVRALNRAWKQAVETQLLPSHFVNKDWRVGLRVIRKLPATHPEMPGEATPEDEVLYRLNVLNRPGAMEPYAVTNQPRTITHVIPLSFKEFDAENVSLRFDTDQTWHSLFQIIPPEEEEEQEQDPPEAETSSDSDDEAPQLRLTPAQARARARADAARLELDFGLVWRFPDDGQDADVYDIKAGDTQSWGEPDPENGWLSRFYCSNFDTVNSEPPTGTSSPAVLQSTPLTRRARSSRLHSAVERRMHDIVDDDDTGFNPAQMIWSDEGHEYMSLDLSLGLEFFVRRSARANQLVRRLEAAAADADARDVVQQVTRKLKKGKNKARKGAMSSLNPSSANSVAASGYTTPLQVASPPPSRITASMDPRRRAMQNALDKEAQKEATLLKGKSKEDDDDDGGGISGMQTPEQPASAPSFLSPSMMPSRFSSAAPSRQGGGSVGSRSSYGSKSRPGKSGSAPRATFQAKLLRAERMPSRPSSPSPSGNVDGESSNSSNAADTPIDRVGWTGGDKFGRGSFRLAQEWSDDLESDKYLDALSNSGVTTPVTWTWSR